MNERYDSSENGSFCIDINHARRFGVASALMITQFRQGGDRVFCRAFPSGNGYSRELKDVLPICDEDAMTILFTAFKPDKPIPEGYKIDGIDNLIAKAKSENAKFWIGDNFKEGSEQEGATGRGGGTAVHREEMPRADREHGMGCAGQPD